MMGRGVLSSKLDELRAWIFFWSSLQPIHNIHVVLMKATVTIALFPTLRLLFTSPLDALL